MLSNLHLENPGAWQELVKEGFGGSLRGPPFSTEHGDLIIETIINREVKVHGEIMQVGHSRKYFCEEHSSSNQFENCNDGEIEGSNFIKV